MGRDVSRTIYPGSLGCWVTCSKAAHGLLASPFHRQHQKDHQHQDLSHLRGETSPCPTQFPRTQLLGCDCDTPDPCHLKDQRFLLWPQLTCKSSQSLRLLSSALCSVCTIANVSDSVFCTFVLSVLMVLWGQYSQILIYRQALFCQLRGYLYHTQPDPCIGKEAATACRLELSNRPFTKLH